MVQLVQSKVVALRRVMVEDTRPSEGVDRPRPTPVRLIIPASVMLPLPCVRWWLAECASIPSRRRAGTKCRVLGMDDPICFGLDRHYA